jgi:hypothetical protein
METVSKHGPVAVLRRAQVALYSQACRCLRHRGLAVAYATAGLLLIELAAILLAIFEAAAWAGKLLVGAVAVGKGHVPVRRLLVRKT